MVSERALVFSGGCWVGVHQAHLLEGPWRWIVCADSGARHALQLGYEPDLLVGDLDSITWEDRRLLSDIPHLSTTWDQEKTDTHIAVDWVLDQGAKEIVIAAGLGTRFDHSLANTHLLFHIHERARGVVTDGRQAIYLLSDYLTLQAVPGTPLSLLPVTPKLEGLTIRGARWELNDATVTLGDTRTISNEFGLEKVDLFLKSGSCFVAVGGTDQ